MDKVGRLAAYMIRELNMIEITQFSDTYRRLVSEDELVEMFQRASEKRVREEAEQEAKDLQALAELYRRFRFGSFEVAYYYADDGIPESWYVEADNKYVGTSDVSLANAIADMLTELPA